MTTVALIGCGWAGARHFDAFEATDASVDWAIDTNRERAASLDGDRHTDTDYRAALADPAVDAVDICLPHYLHAKVAIDALTAGKHVLVEKPLAHSLAAADKMIEAAADTNRVLMVAENVRFDPALTEVQRLVDTGAIGRIALLRVTREADLGEEFRANRPWFFDAEDAAGGIMMAGGIHDVEKCRMLVDATPSSVYAVRARQRLTAMEGDDTSVATVHFDDGTIAVLTESFHAKSLATTSAERHTVRIDGEYGSIVIDHDNCIRLYSEVDEFQPIDGPTEHRLAVESIDTFRAQIEHFLTCIERGNEPITSGRSQRVPLAVVLAAYESMDTGAPVAVRG